MITNHEQLQAIVATEWRLMEPICEFIAGNGYMVFRSERFPNYYGGNGIDILAMGGRTLSEWEAVSEKYFPADRYRHVTYTMAELPETKHFLAHASNSGYEIERTLYMSVNHTQSCRLLPDEFTIKQVESEEEWMRMQQLSEEEDPDQPWYDPSYTGPNRLFEKTRFVSESVGIDWFYIAERGSSEMLAKLGMFIHNGIARLQDVATSRNHRRRGLASYLVSAAIHRALEVEGAALLSLAADMDYHAVDLYRKLGFEDVGEYLTLMKYPILNPVHKNVG